MMRCVFRAAILRFKNKKVVVVKSWKKSLGICVAALSVGCSDIVINLGKDHGGDEGETPQAVSSKNSLDVDSVYDFLQDKDNVKELGAMAVLTELEGGFKGKFRQSVRDLRDAVVTTGTEGAPYSSEGLYGESYEATCRSFDPHNLAGFDGSEYLGVVLKGGVLAGASSEISKKLGQHWDPVLAERIADVFLTKMGMQIKDLDGGEIGPTVVEVDGTKTVTHGLFIDLDAENGPNSGNDDLDIKIQYTQVHKDGELSTFEADMQVGAGLFDDNASGAQYFMNVMIETGKTDQDGRMILSTIKGGTRDNGENVTFSRRLIYSQDQADEHLYSVIDQIRFDMDDETNRRASIDFSSLESCFDPSFSGDIPNFNGL